MGKRVGKRCVSFGLAVLLVFTAVCSFLGKSVTARAEGGAVIKLHYNRADGDYAPWRVWFWEAGCGGADYFFEETDGEQVATMEVSPGVTSVGFIVRTEDWTKDVDMDQFIDISEVISGTVDVYVESGVEGYTKEYGDDVVIGIKLKKASYDNENATIRVEMTAPIEEPEKAYKVFGRDGEIAISEVKAGEDNVYILTPETALDIYQDYGISFDGMEYEVRMPNVYSTKEFEEAYTYAGDDLGAVWTPEKTVFKVWAPLADEVYVNLYESGDASADDRTERLAMTADVNGTWLLEAEGDLNGTYYTYETVRDGESAEACDPYARTTGVNGVRAMVIDLDSTDPEGWENDSDPHAGERITDAVIYELHIRDFSMDESSGMENTGKYLEFTEKGTKTAGGVTTGVDYLKELGITHLHILPMYDFGSVDETNPKFNWGYDPVNYNVPEGSYSTDPYNGEVRVREAKQMVQALHEAGISVVMDVVYNHVHSAEEFCINRLVPGYFSRINEDGSYSSGSGCGNDTASERSMVRKYIVDSVSYWADEYHIDGFRFDLVGLLDVDTINEVMDEVHKTHPDVIFYGEGWTMATEVTKPGVELATQTNSALTPGFAYFNDNIRDGLKGSVFNETEKGYISGAEGMAEEIAKAFVGSSSWCISPAQTVNYASCHDNLTMFDRLKRSCRNTSQEDLIKMNNLAAAVYMTSQGVPFLQAGEEMLRSKVNGDGTFNNNSYNANDRVNSLKWSNLEQAEYRQVVEYYKGLIAFRKAHSVLRLDDAKLVEEHVSRVENVPENVLAFDLTGGVEGETADEMFVIFNANKEAATVALPEGSWNVYINGSAAGTTVLGSFVGEAQVEPITAMVLIREGEAPQKETETTETEVSAEPVSAAEPAEPEQSTGRGIWIVIGCVAAAALCGLAVFLNKKNQRK